MARPWRYLSRSGVPELISRLVLVAGVFHFDGWASGVIDPDAEPPEFLERLYGEVSPDRSRALSGDRRQAVPDATRRATLTANEPVPTMAPIRRADRSRA